MSTSLTRNAFSIAWWLTLLFALVALGNELIRSPLIITLAYTAVMSRKPVPVRPHGPLNAVLTVPFVPKSEDIARLEAFLLAAKRIRTGGGSLIILVLDEGLKSGPSPVRPLVEFLDTLGGGNRIVYFSRREHRIYDDTRQKRKRRKYRHGQKYGNINAGLDYVRHHPEIFGNADVVIGLDHDHVPLPEFCERMTGYFNDPDVAYVVGPQSYENALINVWAGLGESNQSVFHTQIQAAPNRGGGPMFVGTNFIVRMSVLNQIGDIQASKTEDLKTTFAILSRHNPRTGRYWRGVYTPDVLAHGEGPGTYGAWQTQQKRWSGGAFGLIRTPSYWLSLLRMWRRPVVLWHYLSIMSFYPIMALSWILATANITLQTVFGANGELVDPLNWLTFYCWVTFFNVLLYVRMRRYNTSPFEGDGLWAALKGMAMGVMTVPVFVSALFTPGRTFPVTPKGNKNRADRPLTFYLNFGWILWYLFVIAMGVRGGGLNPINLTWSVVALIILIAPIVISKANQGPESDIRPDELPAGQIDSQAVFTENEVK